MYMLAFFRKFLARNLAKNLKKIRYPNLSIYLIIHLFVFHHPSIHQLIHLSFTIYPSINSFIYHSPSIIHHLGFALILFWGRFYLPLPYRVPIVGEYFMPFISDLLYQHLCPVLFLFIYAIYILLYNKFMTALFTFRCYGTPNSC